MPSNSVLFFPSVTGTTGGGGSSLTYSKDVATGALVAHTPTSILHSMGYANYNFEVKDATNKADVDAIYIDPAFPTTKFIIEVGVDLPGGLTVTCQGW